MFGGGPGGRMSGGGGGGGRFSKSKVPEETELTEEPSGEAAAEDGGGAEDEGAVSVTGARTWPVDEPPPEPGGVATVGEDDTGKRGARGGDTGNAPPEEVTLRGREPLEAPTDLEPDVGARAANQGGSVGVFLGRGGITRGPLAFATLTVEVTADAGALTTPGFPGEEGEALETWRDNSAVEPP